MQKDRDKWAKDKTWVEKLRNNVFKAHCTVCRLAFSLAHRGLTDLKRFSSSCRHTRNKRNKTTRRAGDNFIVYQAAPVADTAYFAMMWMNNKCELYGEIGWTIYLIIIWWENVEAFNKNIWNIPIIRHGNGSNRMCYWGALWKLSYIKTALVPTELIL